MSETRSGRCLCGAVTWQYTGPHSWSCYCHCESCRRNTASPVTAFFGVPLERFRWTGLAPTVFASSEGVRRSFCPACGTPMAFEATRYPGEIHLYAIAHEDPASVAPQRHVHADERLPWFRTDDNLPRDGSFAKETGA